MGEQLSKMDFVTHFLGVMEDWNWKYRTGASDQIYIKISWLKTEQLKQLVAWLAENCEYKPKLKDISKALADLRFAREGMERKEYAWEKREKEIAKMMEEAIIKFVKGSDYQHSQAHGYSPDLFNFARHTANTQAQILLGSKLRGWCGDAVPSNYWEEYKRQLGEFSGSEINIMQSMPFGVIPYWINQRAQKIPTQEFQQLGESYELQSE